YFAERESGDLADGLAPELRLSDDLDDHHGFGGGAVLAQALGDEARDDAVGDGDARRELGAGHREAEGVGPLQRPEDVAHPVGEDGRGGLGRRATRLSAVESVGPGARRLSRALAPRQLEDGVAEPRERLAEARPVTPL